MQNIVIVGVGPGLGLSLARRFGGSADNVALIARRQDALDEYVDELAEQNIRAVGFAADVTKEDDMRTTFINIKQKLGDIDVLIYNAARVQPVSALDTSAALTEEHMQVNVLGGIRAAEQVLPDMLKHGRGTILFTGGGRSGLTALPMVTPLSIGKSGLRSYAHCLHDEVKAHGVFVGMLSVEGVIQEGTYYAPDHIAEAYYTFYQQQDRKEVFYINPDDVS